jgi:hypothetical protein
MEDNNNMTMQAHLVELERRHQALEDKIAAHSSSDNLKIVEMKRQKLQLEDKIERLRHDGASGDRACANYRDATTTKTIMRSAPSGRHW